jgi:large subunit ribosomal protein L13
MTSKTFSQSKEQALANRKWLVIDAAGIPVGRLATKIAFCLRGKHKPTYTPHVDGGDFVVVINAAKVRLTGRKRDQKKYYHHTGYVGGLKVETAGEALKKHPERVIEHAVFGMLPKGALGHQIQKKLKVYPSSDHPHIAQNPTLMKIES